MWVVAALLVAGLVSRLQALLLARVTVPPFGLGGAAASLGCEYDPQGDAVYSVKWYKVSSRLVPGMLSAVCGRASNKPSRSAMFCNHANNANQLAHPYDLCISRRGLLRDCVTLA